MFKKLLLYSIFFMPIYIFCEVTDPKFRGVGNRQSIEDIDGINRQVTLNLSEGTSVTILFVEPSEEQKKELDGKLAIIEKKCRSRGWGKECKEAIEELHAAYLKYVGPKGQIRTIVSKKALHESGKLQTEADSQ